jgi:anti-sigma factor RsiW
MINYESQLKLQAYLDGELPAREAAEVKDWLARDQEATALLEEFRGTNTVLAGHVAEIRLPESREFYWSKIQREIERQEKAAPVQRVSVLAWLRGHLMPVAGVAAFVAVCGVLALHSGRAGGQFGEMELASDDMGSYTFRDQQQKMTMVWLYDRTDDSQTTAADTAATVTTEAE